jgi:outer membrane biosynthesis protein TonB
MTHAGSLGINGGLDEAGLRTMIVLSAAIHLLAFGLLFFFPRMFSSPRVSPLDLAAPIVTIIGERDLPGSSSPASTLVMPKAKSALPIRKPEPVKETAEVKKLAIPTLNPKTKETVVPKPAPTKTTRGGKATADQQLAQAIDAIRKRAGKGAGAAGTGRTTDVRGGTGPGESTLMQVYTSIVIDRIMEAWFLPPALQQEALARGLISIVNIRIQRDGTVVLQALEQSSGNSLYDEYALAAIKKVELESFPPLPKEFRDPFLELGIRFHPSEVNNP